MLPGPGLQLADSTRHTVTCSEPLMYTPMPWAAFVGHLVVIGEEFQKNYRETSDIIHIVYMSFGCS